jgi:hypothetical protein
MGCYFSKLGHHGCCGQGSRGYTEEDWLRVRRIGKKDSELGHPLCSILLGGGSITTTAGVWTLVLWRWHKTLWTRRNQLGGVWLRRHICHHLFWTANGWVSWHKVYLYLTFLGHVPLIYSLPSGSAEDNYFLYRCVLPGSISDSWRLVKVSMEVL